MTPADPLLLRLDAAQREAEDEYDALLRYLRERIEAHAPDQEIIRIVERLNTLQGGAP